MCALRDLRCKVHKEKILTAIDAAIANGTILQEKPSLLNSIFSFRNLKHTTKDEVCRTAFSSNRLNCYREEEGRFPMHCEVFVKMLDYRSALGHWQHFANYQLINLHKVNENESL